MRFIGLIFCDDAIRYYANLKAITYESTSLDRIVADQSHRVDSAVFFIFIESINPLSFSSEKAIERNKTSLS